MNISGKDLNEHIRTISIYIILTASTMFVLLPLFWMFITALKQPGYAMKIKFIPDRETETAIYPATFTPSEHDNPVMAIEYSDPGAAKVTIAGDFNGWNKDILPMKSYDGIWIAYIDNIKPGKHEFKIVVDDNWDKANKDNRAVEVQPNGLTSNIPLTNASEVSGNKADFRFHRPDAVGIKALVNLKGHNASTIEVVLSKSDDGYWTGKSNFNDPIISYRFKVKRSFTAAWCSLYTISNFKEVFNNQDFPFKRFFLNSLIVSLVSAFITVIICSMGGYIFSKKPFPGSDKVFKALLSSMMIPGMIFMVPQFALVNKFHWINTYAGMIVPHLGNVFGLFLMKQYIDTIPDSLFGAAKIDGASEWQIFRHIIMPLSKSITITLFIMVFAFQWNNFLWQLIVNTPDSAYRTLPVGLALFRGQYAIEWEKMMAAACFSVVPIAILFLFAQKQFIAGMTGGAVKE